MFSLEKLCLNIIVDEFERFNFAFHKSDDVVLKRNFKFLRRAYTFNLWAELLLKSKLKDKYFDFLINEHLEFLDDSWFRNTRYEDGIKDFICLLPNLKMISLSMKCGDEVLENVAKFCPKIIEIRILYSSGVSDAGIKYLCENGKVSCPVLRTLCINSPRVTDCGLMDLIKSFPSLQRIYHMNVPCALFSTHKESLKNLEMLPSYNLIDLDLSVCIDLPYYNDLLKVCLKVCPKLKRVSCCITNRKQLDFFNHKSLEILILNASKCNQKIDINDFLQRNGRNLISLSVGVCIININVLAKSCPKIQRMEIFKCDFTHGEDDDHQVLIFRCLNNCIFLNETFDILSIKAVNSILLSSPKLHYLSFKFCDLSNFTEIGLLKFCENNLLTYIKIFHCYVDIRIVKDILLNCSHLETMELYALDKYDPNEKKELMELIGALPNKPNVFLNLHDNYE